MHERGVHTHVHTIHTHTHPLSGKLFPLILAEERICQLASNVQDCAGAVRLLRAIVDEVAKRARVPMMETAAFENMVGVCLSFAIPLTSRGTAFSFEELQSALRDMASLKEQLTGDYVTELSRLLQFPLVPRDGALPIDPPVHHLTLLREISKDFVSAEQYLRATRFNQSLVEHIIKWLEGKPNHFARSRKFLEKAARQPKEVSLSLSDSIALSHTHFASAFTLTLCLPPCILSLSLNPVIFHSQRTKEDMQQKRRRKCQNDLRSMIQRLFKKGPHEDTLDMALGESKIPWRRESALDARYMLMQDTEAVPAAAKKETKVASTADKVAEESEKHSDLVLSALHSWFHRLSSDAAEVAATETSILKFPLPMSAASSDHGALFNDLTTFAREVSSRLDAAVQALEETWRAGDTVSTFDTHSLMSKLEHLEDCVLLKGTNTTLYIVRHPLVVTDTCIFANTPFPHRVRLILSCVTSGPAC